MNEWEATLQVYAVEAGVWLLSFVLLHSDLMEANMGRSSPLVPDEGNT